MKFRLALWATSGLAVTGVGCGEAPQTAVEIPLIAQGGPASEVIVSEELTVRVERADFAFGPLYLCPGAQAGELCDSARLEWLESAVIDGTHPGDQNLGTLKGVSGAVRSYMFDFGISSLLTQEEPLVSPAAQALGGLSAVFEGQAQLADQAVPFVIEVLIAQGEEAERGVQVVRRSSSETFSHEVTGEEAALVVAVDPGLWLAELRAADFVSEDSCSADGPDLVCAGSVQQTCGPDGEVQESVQCADAGQVCLPAVGCKDLLRFGRDSEVARRLAFAMVSGARPQLSFR